MNTTHRLSLALVIGTLSSSALAVNCKEAITTPDVNQCARIDQQKAEAKLNKVYQRLLSSLNQPDSETEKFSDMKKTLIEAQRAWIKFRQADCDAVFSKHMGGTIRTVAFIACMQKHAERRIEELELYEKE